MDLDEETRAELGWGTDARDSTTHYVSAQKPSRTPVGEVDGRHRRNWRRKAAGRAVAGKAALDSTRTAVSRDNAQGEAP